MDLQPPPRPPCAANVEYARFRAGRLPRRSCVGQRPRAEGKELQGEKKPRLSAASALRGWEFFGRVRGTRQNASNPGAKHGHSAGYGEHVLSTSRDALACKSGLDERLSASHPCTGGAGTGSRGVSEGDCEGGGSGVWAGVWLGGGAGVCCGVALVDGGTGGWYGDDAGGAAGRRPGTMAGVLTPWATAAIELNTNTVQTPICWMNRIAVSMERATSVMHTGAGQSRTTSHSPRGLRPTCTADAPAKAVQSISHGSAAAQLRRRRSTVACRSCVNTRRSRPAGSSGSP